MAKVQVTVRMNDQAVIGLMLGDTAQNKLDNAAEAALRMQKALVPVDTGKLSKHLEIRKTANGKGREVGAFGVDYALPVETGHRTRSGSWVPAQPFIRPSIDAVRKSLKNA